MKLWILLCLIALPAWAAPAHFSKGATVSGSLIADHLVGEGSGITGISGGGGSVAIGIPGRSNLVVRTDLGTSTSTVVSVTANYLTLVSSTGSISVSTNVSVSANVTLASQAGGRDSATSLSNSTWYDVDVISGISGTWAILETAYPPILPSGYAYYTRVGSVRTDASGTGALLKEIQRDNAFQFVATKSTNTPAAPIIASGSAGNSGTPTYISVTTTGCLPPTASSIHLSTGEAGAQIMVAPNNSYGAFGSTTNSAPIIANSGASGDSTNGYLILESSNVWWTSNNSNNRLYCLGGVDNL